MTEQRTMKEIKQVESWVEDASSSHAEGPADQVAGQVQRVIDAAERAAEAIRADAEQQAQSYLAEAQARAEQLTAERVELIAGLTDELIEHAEAVRVHSAQMATALEHTVNTDQRRYVEGDRSAELSSGAEVRPTRAARSEPTSGDAFDPGQSEAMGIGNGDLDDRAAADDADEAEDAVPVSDAEAEDAALLQATRLAIAGSDRVEIAQALRDRFGIAEPAPIVEKVLGAA